MQAREEMLMLAKLAQKEDMFSEELGVLDFMVQIAKKEGCSKLSWDERRLTELAIKIQVNKLRKAIDFVAA